MTDGLNSINRVLPGLIEPGSKPATSLATEKPDGEFSELFARMIDSVNDLQNQSAETQQAMINGEPIELHQVMIKAREAGVAMDMLLEVRNKLITAFSEIMRMPM